MNVFQLAQNLVFALSPSQFVWPDPPSEPVLSRAIVGPGTPDFFQHDAPAPFAIVHPESVKDSAEHPADLVDEARFTIYLFAANASEQSGGAAVMGGNRQSLGSSRGRGLLEIEPLVKAQILNQLGLVARPRTTGAQAPAVAGRMAGLIAERALEVVATRLQSQPSWAPVTQLKASVAGGVVTLTWKLPPSRYDLLGVVVRRETVQVDGYPPDPFTGTDVPVSGLLQTITNTPGGSGAWRYSVFAAYDVTRDPFTLEGQGSPNRYAGFFNGGPVPPPPGAFAATPGVGGIGTAGLHLLYVSFLTNGVESALSPAASVLFAAGGTASMTGIPLGPAGTTARNVYMTTAAGSVPFFVGAVANNTSTTASANISDGGLQRSYAYKPANFVYAPAQVSATV